MQFVNDDMDDLMRRAGKDYPLNTNGGDWEKIANALNEKKAFQLSKRKNRQTFYLLFLSIPVLLPYILGGDAVRNSLKKEMGALKAKQVLSEQKNVYAADLRKELPPPVKYRQLTFINDKNTPGVNDFYLQKAIGNNLIYNTNEFSENNIESYQPGAFYPNDISPVETMFGGEIEFNLLKKNVQRQNITPEQSLKSPSDKKIKRFYAGVVSGAGATTVKLQKINNYGFDIGFIAGYDINKKWSLEAGILSTQKRYFTDGKEFNTSKMYLPPNTKITTVDGGCRMLEIPVVARYHFSSSQRNTWFVSEGISSYLMKEENYDYTYLYTNSGRTVKYSKAYKDASENWVSTAQVSGGYIFNVKDKLEIRAEPYLQIPLKGVGFGNLPLTNTGLRIAITKKLF